MTPAARVQAAIEILDQIQTGTAAEKALTGWARRSRFAGSGDRAAVRDHVFDTLRCRQSFAVRGGGTDGRALMLGGLLTKDIDPDALFTGLGYAPAPLSDTEKTLCADTDAGATDPVDLPEWLWDAFQGSLGDRARGCADALRKRAPVFLRVNARRSDVATARISLERDRVIAQAHDSSDHALIVQKGERAIRNSSAYLSGLVELQDGASQALVDALPLSDGDRVLDYCAGGGGKTLAMAARHDLSLVAHDISDRRMADLEPRAQRAGIDVSFSQTADLPKAGPFDLVLCDAPCSGSGAWRRSPEAKWTLSPDDFDALLTTQAQILEQAAHLVKSGGRLAYATCSVLKPENMDQISAFLESRSDWQLESHSSWLPEGDTDGFFLAVLKQL